MMVIGLEGANNEDIIKQCNQLEIEMRTLRERLDRSEAQRLAGLYEGEMKAEKDVEATGDWKEKGGNEDLPTYGS